MREPRRLDLRVARKRDTSTGGCAEGVGIIKVTKQTNVLSILGRNMNDDALARTRLKQPLGQLASTRALRPLALCLKIHLGPPPKQRNRPAQIPNTATS